MALSNIFSRLLLCFALLNVFGLHAADLQPATAEECQKLIDQGKKFKAAGKYVDALELYTKAEVIAEERNLEEKLFDIKNDFGDIYWHLSNYGEALENCQEALEIATKTPALKDKIILILNNIAVLYAHEKDYNNALLYLNRALDFGENNKVGGYNRVFFIINIADIYNKLGNYKEARKNLLEIKPLVNSESVKKYWEINYAETLMLEGNLQEAQKMAENSVKAGAASNPDIYMSGANLLLLSKIYGLQNKVTPAIEYAKKGLGNMSTLEDKINLYNHLADLYIKKGEYPVAIRYKDSVNIAKDSVSSLINIGLYQTNKVKLKVQEYQNELNVNREKYAAERKFYIAVIFFSLLLLYFTYRGLRNRTIKQKQEQKLAEKQQQIFTLELENLKSNIAEKNRKLSTKALYLSGRNKLINEVINSLTNISDINKNKPVLKYITSLKDYVKTDTEWDDFAYHFEQVNPEFLKRLKLKHPELTAKDIRFLCYIYMNLDAKELSIIFNVTPDACRRREKRLLQKMNVDTEDSLYEYLLTFA